MRWHLPFVVDAAVALAATALTGIPFTANHAQRTFRAGTDVVMVDFIAVTRDGDPVANLLPGDVTLKVDGRPRPIQDFQFIRLVKEARPSVTAGATSPIASIVTTNVVEEVGRTIYLVFDDNTIGPGGERAAKDAADRFLSQLSAGDRVALVTVGGVEVELTTNHERIRAALRNVMGHARTAIQMSGPARIWLRGFFESIQAIEGPKTVVLVSQGESPRPNSEADYLDIGKVAGAARAQLYIIQPNGDTGAIPRQELEQLAGVTGGELFRISGTADAVFDRVLRESAAYYLFGFIPEATDRNGKSHRIEVRVTRNGVSVRSRPAFTLPKARIP